MDIQMDRQTHMQKKGIAHHANNNVQCKSDKNDIRGIGDFVANGGSNGVTEAAAATVATTAAAAMVATTAVVVAVATEKDGVKKGRNGVIL